MLRLKKNSVYILLVILSKTIAIRSTGTGDELNVNGSASVACKKRPPWILAGTCEACHSLDRVQEARANEEQWRSLLLAMIGRGAALPLSDVEPLVEWLARTRGTNPTN